jgi:arabinogalactan endo-1,4-beta-galactosidase
VRAACIAALAAVGLLAVCLLSAAEAPSELGRFLLGADITGVETTPAGGPVGQGPGSPIVTARAGGPPPARAATPPVARAPRAPFTYQEDGKPGDELTILHNHGWNAFRVRIFVPPVRSAPNNPLVNGVPLAKRIKALGASLLLCVHFSDTWADPGKQYIPLAWEGEDIAGLEKEWEHHAFDVVKTMKDAGAMPDMIQIGNEITNGAAWPIARVQFPKPDQAPPFPDYDDSLQWDNLTRLLKAGVKGAKAAAGKSPLKIAIHIDQCGHWDKTQWFFDHLEAAKVPYDIIAQSCYPQYGHATPEELVDNMSRCAQRYRHKEFLVVETGYSARGGPRAGMTTAAADGRPGRDLSRYFLWPTTPEGQLQFMVDMVNMVRKSPNGTGVFYWAPERAIWNADGTPGPAVFTPENLTKLANRPESHVPESIR